MSESNQKKIGRVRPPRVHITYDVETGGAIQVKELPFIVGVLADLSITPENPLPPLRERKFVEIDRDNFQAVMAAAKPRVDLKVIDRLAAPAAAGQPDPTTKVELTITHMDQLEPVALVQAIEPLSDLFDKRNRYRDFLGKLDGNDELDEVMVKLVTRKATDYDSTKDPWPNEKDPKAEPDPLIALFTGKTPEQWRAVVPAADSLLEKMVGLMTRSPAQNEYALELIGQMAVGILEDASVEKLPKDAAAIMNDQIAKIDALASTDVTTGRERRRPR